VLPDVEFLWTIAREGIGARQVGKQELIAEHLGVGLGGINGDTTIVAYMGMGTRGEIEE
jgi:hypothetical protein